MALFLGNLSPRVRCDELERIFRRFGRSNVQLKDGYGFVIYDVLVNAERALRALRGKVICGQRISLTWANKQPRPFQNFARSGRFSETQHGRSFMREENDAVIGRSSQDRRDYATGKSKYLNRDSGEKGYVGDNTEEQGVEKSQNLEDRVMGQGDALDSNPLESDRWGHPVGDSFNNAVDETDFDRYEPYHGFGQGDETEKQQITSSYESGHGGSPVRQRKEQSGFEKPKSQAICFVCGLVGHKMRNCPKADVSRRRFGRRQDGGIESRGRSDGRVKKLRQDSWRRSDGREIISRWHLSARKDSGSWKPRRFVNRSDNFPDERKYHRSQPVWGSQGKKKRRKECGTPNKHHRKRARASVSSRLHLDSTASFQSCSSSPKSVSGISSHSRSRSVFSRSHSTSSSSRSTAALSYSHSRSSRSKLRSRSSRSLSPSISLGQQSPSLGKVQIDVTVTSPKDDMGNVTIPKSSDVLHERRSPAGDVGLDSLECNDVVTVQKGEINEMQPPKGGVITITNSSSQHFMETDNLQKSEPVHMDPTVSPFRTLQPQSPVNFQPGSSTRISSQEMCMVLKHYGLKVLEESEHPLSVNSFFGAARLWPWEMIYYRRLKKGPISTENYARRIEQNREFGIVDKYIRSSSGWFECDESSM